MPSKWAMVDSNFPTFRGDEKPAQQLAMLVDYMYILVEELKYQMSNLDTDNWNESALAGFQDDTVAEAEAQLAKIAVQLAGVSGALGGLTNRVAELEALGDRVKQTEEDISGLEQSNDELKRDLASLRDWATDAEGQLEEMAESLEALGRLLVPDSNGGCSLGAQGQDLHLVGNVYINGKLME